MTGVMIGLGVVVLAVAVLVFARSGISDRWDRVRGHDRLAAEAGDAATMILANHAALPMHDHSFDKPR